MIQKIIKFLTSKAFLANLAVVVIFGAAALTLPALFNPDENPVSGLENKTSSDTGSKQTAEQVQEEKELGLLHEPENAKSTSEENTGRILHATACKTQTQAKCWVLTITVNGTETVSYAEIYKNKLNIKIDITKTENGFNGHFEITKDGILIQPPADSETEYVTGIYWAAITYDGLSCEITNKVCSTSQNG